MPIKERLGEELEDSLAEGVDDLDRAYLKELKESGVSDSLLEQFRKHDDRTKRRGKRRITKWMFG